MIDRSDLLLTYRCVRQVVRSLGTLDSERMRMHSMRPRGDATKGNSRRESMAIRTGVSDRDGAQISPEIG